MDEDYSYYPENYIKQHEGVKGFGNIIGYTLWVEFLVFGDVFTSNIFQFMRIDNRKSYLTLNERSTSK